CGRVEMTKALRHNDGYVISASIGLIVPDILLNVDRAAAHTARQRNGGGITFDPGNRVTTAAKGPCMPSHSAANIDNVAEVRQRRAHVETVDFLAWESFDPVCKK